VQGDGSPLTGARDTSRGELARDIPLSPFEVTQGCRGWQSPDGGTGVSPEKPLSPSEEK